MEKASTNALWWAAWAGLVFGQVMHHTDEAFWRALVFHAGVSNVVCSVCQWLGGM